MISWFYEPQPGTYQDPRLYEIAKHLPEGVEFQYNFESGSENFILSEETITFVYNPYEIAPYNVGSTELIIPFSDIKELLKNSFTY